MLKRKKVSSGKIAQPVKTINKANSLMAKSYDIIIIGGGPVGLLMASLLADLSYKLALIEPQPYSPQKNADLRTLALAQQSLDLLNRCGLWQPLAAGANPIRDIRVTDAAHPWCLSFNSKDIKADSFGAMVEHGALMQCLWRAAATQKNLTLYSGHTLKDFSANNSASEINATLDNGQKLTVKLLLAADGRTSFCREHAGIRITASPYQASALVATLAHNQPHGDWALEDFRPGGPLAVLPLRNNRVGLVWTDSARATKTRLQQNEADFIAELQPLLGSWLGKMRLVSQRQSWPLHLQNAERYHDTRLALLGDAAHVMHPIAGQGLNLAMRDMAYLAQLLANASDPGDAELLGRYTTQRRADVLKLLLTTDILDRLFSNNLPPIKWARRAGLALVEQIPPLKRFFMREAMGGQ